MEAQQHAKGEHKVRFLEGPACSLFSHTPTRNGFKNQTKYSQLRGPPKNSHLWGPLVRPLKVLPEVLSVSGLAKGLNSIPVMGYIFAGVQPAMSPQSPFVPMYHLTVFAAEPLSEGDIAGAGHAVEKSNG